MPAQRTDKLIVDRGGVNYRTTVGEVLAAALKGQATITLPYGVGALDWTEAVNVAGVQAGDVIMCQLAELDDSFENTASWIDLVSLSALAGAGSITFTLVVSVPLSGPVIINWKVN